MDQMVWFRENWYEEVLRQLRQGLAKCYVIAFDNRQGVQVRLTFDSTHDLCTAKWKGIRVEANVANFPLLSLFRREENRDGNTCNFNTLHSY